MYSTITRLPPRSVCLFGVTAAILPMLRALRERFRKSRNRDGVNAITKMLRTAAELSPPEQEGVVAAEHLSVDGRMEMEDTEGKEEEPGGWTAPYWNDEFSRQRWRGGSQRRARAVPVQRSVRCCPARSIRRLEAGQGSLHVPAHATSRDRRRRGSRGR